MRPSPGHQACLLSSPSEAPGDERLFKEELAVSQEPPPPTRPEKGKDAEEGVGAEETASQTAVPAKRAGRWRWRRLQEVRTPPLRCRPHLRLHIVNES